MVLVPYDQHDSNKKYTPTTPLGVKIVTLDDQMENILKDNSLTDNQKVEKYSAIMQKFMDYQDQYNRSTNIQVSPEGATIPMVDKVEKSDDKVEKMGAKVEILDKVENFGDKNMNISQVPITEFDPISSTLSPSVSSLSTVDAFQSELKSNKSKKNKMYYYNKTWLYLKK